MQFSPASLLCCRQSLHLTFLIDDTNNGAKMSTMLFYDDGNDDSAITLMKVDEDNSIFDSQLFIQLLIHLSRGDVRLHNLWDWNIWLDHSRHEAKKKNIFLLFSLIKSHWYRVVNFMLARRPKDQHQALDRRSPMSDSLRWGKSRMNYIVATLWKAALRTELCWPANVLSLGRLSIHLCLGHRLNLHMSSRRIVALYSIDLWLEQLFESMGWREEGEWKGPANQVAPCEIVTKVTVDKLLDFLYRL